MVLPPTGLTNLLYSIASNPDAIYTVLQRAGCLTQKAVRDPAPVKALIAQILEAEATRPPMPGPSTADVLARALRSSPFLSAKGMALSVSPRGDAPAPSN
jgi:hypothetical protein